MNPHLTHEPYVTEEIHIVYAFLWRYYRWKGFSDQSLNINLTMESMSKEVYVGDIRSSVRRLKQKLDETGNVVRY